MYRRVLRDNKEKRNGVCVIWKGERGREREMNLVEHVGYFSIQPSVCHMAASLLMVLTGLYTTKEQRTLQ